MTRSGAWREHEGGVEDCLQQSRRAAAAGKAAVSAAGGTKGSAGVDAKALNVAPPAVPKRKLGYKEQRELDGLPARIQALEDEQSALDASMAEPKFHVQPAALIAQAHARHAVIEAELMMCLERWELLGTR